MFSSAKHPVLTGTAILTCAGILSRLIGFFYRIFLSRTIGAQGLGIYQMIFPVYAFLPLRCHRRHSECLIPLLLRRFIQGKSEKGMGIFPEWQRTFCGTFTDRVLFSLHPRTLDQPSYLT